MMGVIAGAICGVLSGMGIGGGTLLMVWLTAVAQISQDEAQGINLLYFLPTAIVSLYFHWKNKLLKLKVILPAALSGVVTAGLVSWLAGNLDMTLLRKSFGGFLIFAGVKELCYRERNAK